ncbi:MAG: metal ABC transporter substrate-binding protein [Pseudomonadota bacterium]|jgi:zinc/manganese transport system substrate-binding protein|nr:metal ABC transporter substrate-binding protein [Alphaproteobacteria bacterium]
MRPFAQVLFIISSLSFLQAETVVCSFSILKDLCEQLCDGIAEISVDSIVPNSADPHTYQPSPNISKILAKADLVIVNGLNLEGWLDQLIEASGYTGYITIASEGVTPRYIGNLPDPHIWHDPMHVCAMIDTMTDALTETFPKHKEKIESNREKLMEAFKKLKVNIAIQFSAISKERRVMLTTHDAFAYFGEAFDIKVLSPHGISTSDDPSAKDMATLVKQIQSLNISAIFLEHLSNPTIVKVIAEETKKEIKGTLYADSLKPGLHLQDTIWDNAKTITEAMTSA